MYCSNVCVHPNIYYYSFSRHTNESTAYTFKMKNHWHWYTELLFQSSRKVFQYVVTWMQDLLPFIQKSMSELRHDIGRWGPARTHRSDVCARAPVSPYYRTHSRPGRRLSDCAHRRHAALTCVAHGSALENRVFHPSYGKADRPSPALSKSLSLIIAPKKPLTKKLNNCLLHDWSLAK